MIMATGGLAATTATAPLRGRLNKNTINFCELIRKSPYGLARNLLQQLAGLLYSRITIPRDILLLGQKSVPKSCLEMGLPA